MAFEAHLFVAGERLMTYRAAGVAAVVALALAPASSVVVNGSQGPAVPSQVNARGAATKAFLDRIQEYVTYHDNVEKMVPRLRETPDPEEIAKREAALAAAIIKQRPNAREGDFFIKEFQPYLVQIIKEDFAKRPVEDRKALVVELPKNVPVKVNAVYPTTLPLATFPPKLLAALPELPKELEYRIVGRHLILRDVTANVVVDLMRDVFPIPGRS
jgi:hypothetical protein